MIKITTSTVIILSLMVIFSNITLAVTGSGSAPVFGTPSPADGSINQETNLTWSIPIEDPEGDTFDWTIECSNGQSSEGYGEPPYYTPSLPSSGHFELKWSKSTTEIGVASNANAIIQDVDGDGIQEIFLGGKTNFTVGETDPKLRLACLNGSTGNMIWNEVYDSGYASSGNNYFWPLVYDFNKDGAYEVIVDSGAGPTVMRDATSGAEIWNNSDVRTGWHQQAYVDFGNEVFLYLLGGPGSSTFIKKVNGSTGEIVDSTSQIYECWGGPAIADLDGDGHYELFTTDRAITGRGLRCFNMTDLSLKWGRDDILCSSQSPYIADFDEDGELEVMVVDQGSPPHCYIFNSTGFEEHESTESLYHHHQACVGNVDDDNHLELICGDGTSPKIYDLYTHEAVTPGWEIVANVGEIYDVIPDENNINEILHTGDQVGWETASIWRYNVISEAYEELFSFDHRVMWSVAADVDFDGYKEIVMGWHSNWFVGSSYVWCYETNAPADWPAPLTNIGFGGTRRLNNDEFIEPPGVYEIIDYGEHNGTKNLTLTNLEYSTEYTIWVNATDGNSWTRESYTFTTKQQGSSEITSPVVITDSPIDITDTTANLWGNLVDNGGEDCSVWFEYSDEELEESCCGIVATGSVVKDGRSIFWKTRHSSSTNEEPSYRSTGINYHYWKVGMQGMNEAGLAIGNLVTGYMSPENREFPHTELQGDGLSSRDAIMNYCLGTFDTVADAAYYIARDCIESGTQFGIVSAEERVGAVVGMYATGGIYYANISWVNNTFAPLANQLYCEGVTHGTYDSDGNCRTINAICEDIIDNGGFNGDHLIGWEEMSIRGCKSVSDKELGSGSFSTSGEISKSTNPSSLVYVSGSQEYGGALNFAWLYLGRQPLVGQGLPLVAYIRSGPEVPSWFKDGTGISQYVAPKANYATHGSGQSSNTYWCEEVQEIQDYTNFNENVVFDRYDILVDSIPQGATQTEVEALMFDFMDEGVDDLMNAYIAETRLDTPGPDKTYPHSSGPFSETIIDLTPGTIYYYIAHANNTEYAASGSQVIFLTRPSEPTNIQVIVAGQTQIDISWTKGTGADNTIIERNILSGWSRGEGTQIYNGTGSNHDDTGLSAGTHYYYQLWSFTSAEGKHQYSSSYSSGDGTTTGSEPFTLKWTFTTPNEDFSMQSPLVSKDINGDGIHEIFFGGINITEPAGQDAAVLYCIDGLTGEEIWSETLCNEAGGKLTSSHIPISIGDLDNDGTYELIQGMGYGNYQGTIARNCEDGSVFWQSESNLNAKYHNTVIVDADGTGYPYVYIVGDDTSGNYPDKGKIRKLYGTNGTQVLNPDGTEMAYQMVHPCYGGISAADLNNDGNIEILCTDRDWASGGGPRGMGLHCFDEDLNLLWRQTNLSCSSHCAAIVDYNDDGVLDVFALNQAEGDAFILNGIDGALIKGSKGAAGFGAHTQFAVYDIDKDGQLEAIVGYSEDAKVFDLVDWTVEHTINKRVSEPPDVANVMGDEDMEIIVCSGYGDVIVDSNYNVIENKIGGSYTYSGWSVVQDVDDDGLNELFLYNTGIIKCFDTLAEASNPGVRTDTPYYSERRTGVAEYIPPISGSSEINNPPVFLGCTPSDGTTGVPISISSLSITIEDPDGDSFDWTIETSPDVGSNFANGAGNGSKSCIISGLDYSTTYTWFVNATDGNSWTRESYSFTTENDITKPNIEFVPPTPDDNDQTSNTYVYINVSVTDESDTSSFIDWDDSLVGYWNFEHTDSTYVYDSSTHGNHGAFSGSDFGESSLITGKYGDALEFDGDNDYIDLGTPTEFDSETLTYSAWIKTSSSADDMRIVVNQQSASNPFILVMDTGHIVVATAQSDAYEEGWSSSTHNDGAWHHVVAVRNGDSVSNTELYIDGANVALADSGDIWSFNGNAKIGAKSNTQFWFNGVIDEVQIWNRALSWEEINASYNSKVNRLYHNFTGLSDGNYLYYAHAINTAGNENTTETRNIEITPVTLDVTYSGSGSGTVNVVPAGPYHYGDIVTLTANADDGSHFVEWDDDLSGNDNPITFQIYDNMDVDARFDLDSYTLTINTIGSGTVIKDPDQASYAYGDIVELTAVANTGWSFSHWSGDLTGNDNPDTIEITDDMSVTAVFTQNKYTLTVIIAGDGSGTVDVVPAGPYYYGDVVELTANPADGSTFAGWGGDLTGDDNPTDITITGNMVVTAHFTQEEYTLTITTSGSGTVNVVPAGPYNYGDTVTIEAIPDIGSHFVTWSDDHSGNTNPDTITIYGDMTVDAQFDLDSYTLTINVIGNGAVIKDPDQDSYVYGDIVTLTANPADGSTFAGWGGDLTGDDNPATIMITGDMSVTAVFTQNQYTLTVIIVGDGSVDIDPAGPYVYGDVVTLEAIPDIGWSFSHWSGDLTGDDNPTDITITGNMVVTAHFTQTYDLTMAVDPFLGGTTTPAVGTHTYDEGTVVDIDANVNSGWVFDHWEGDVNDLPTQKSNHVTMDEDQTATAIFLELFTLDVTTVGSGTVTLNPPGGTYADGAPVQLTATADSGWTFDHWSDDLTGSTNPDMITMDRDKTVTAHFTHNAYTLTVDVDGNGVVTKDPDQTTYAYGDTVELEAVADLGWTFSYWSGDLDGSVNPESIVMDGDKVVTAHFTQTVPPDDGPVFSDMSIGNGTTGVSIGTSSLSITIEDPDGDTFNWTIETSPDIGSSSGNNDSNDSKTCVITGLAYSGTYSWHVHATDGNSWTNESYWFTIEAKPDPGDGDGDGDGGDGDGDTDNPIANVSAGEPYQGFVGENITFNGSLSYDPDGNITSWYWDFGDGTNGTGNITTHVYSSPGTYTVTLTVTDDEGADGTDETTALITQPNRPPSSPEIDGPTEGNNNTEYTYTAVSTDEDNDTIKYTFDWGDENTNISEFLLNGTSFTINHSWAAAGKYVISVKAYDNETYSGITEFTVWIDAADIGDIGYLIDINGDGVYDLFHNDETGQETEVEQQDDESYLIDSNGDSEWDHEYDSETKTLSGRGQEQKEEEKQISLPLYLGFVTIGFAIIIFVCLAVFFRDEFKLFLSKHRKRRISSYGNEKETEGQPIGEKISVQCPQCKYISTIEKGEGTTKIECPECGTKGWGG